MEKAQFLFYGFFSNDFSTGDSFPPLWFKFFFFGIFGLVLAIFILGIGSSIVTRIKDRTKPIIPAEATVIAKRTKVWGDHARTTYYTTFELSNNQRLEFEIPDHKAGLLVEGDKGTLTFQGNIFVDFQTR